MKTDWRVYLCDRTETIQSNERKEWLKNVPPWRKKAKPKPLRKAKPTSPMTRERGQRYVSSSCQWNSETPVDPYEESQVNMGLILRRPILIEGPPGIGKSALAYHIAWSLDLGDPLRWEINSRTTLEDGLYKYRAVDHLREIQSLNLKRDSSQNQEDSDIDMGQFITLGPLGTALAPSKLPRVLLIDELDKANFDLPNDLLHVFEEAMFKIPELVTKGVQKVLPYDCDQSDEDKVQIHNGTLNAYHHPIMLITSNNERPFSPAFLRRCIRLKLELPSKDHLYKIVQTQIGEEISQDDFDAFYHREHPHELTTDFVLQALFAEQRYQVPPDRIQLK